MLVVAVSISDFGSFSTNSMSTQLVENGQFRLS